MVNRMFEVLNFLSDYFGNEELNWALTGSCNFYIQGLDVSVADIDIQTDKEGAYQIDKLLAQYSLREVTYSETENICSHFGIFIIDGVTVEVMGDMRKKLPDGTWEKQIDLKSNIVYAYYKRLKLPVLSLEYEAEAYERLGRKQKARMLRNFLEQDG